MTAKMRRREFMALLGGAAAAWPLAARAEQPIPVVGFIAGGSPDASAHFAAAFRTGLNEIGFVEGQNVRVEYHWLEGNTISCRRSRPIWLVVVSGMRRGETVPLAGGREPAFFH